MSTLKDIEVRHGRDRLKDVLFIVAAVVLTALSIGSVTSKAAGSNERSWSLSVVESSPEIVQR